MRNAAFELARKAHEGQLDKGGRPYIEHPLTVERLVSTPIERIVALLHDVVEDTDVTIDDLEPFGKEVVAAVDAITKRSGEKLEDYLSRVKANAVARAVKIADLTHNSDLSRIPNPTQRDLDRAARYRCEIASLQQWD
jgi:(p)ppGpp synthase/HD superfamily hydrolase